MNDTPKRKTSFNLRVRIGMSLAILGLTIFVLGVNPGLFHLDRSPVMGFVQIAVFLVGLAFICLGGYIALNTLWRGKEKSIPADIGFRLVATGYVICVTTAMADIFGFGHQSFPQIPYFGPWQALGVILGEVVIIVGFLLFIPWERQKPSTPSDS